MIAVITKTPKYYTQNNTHCKLRTVIESFRYDINSGINNIIVDQAVDDSGNVLEILTVRNSSYTFEEINNLFIYMNTPITLELPFMDQLSTLIATALLIETQTNPRRGTQAADWEMYVDVAPIVDTPVPPVE